MRVRHLGHSCIEILGHNHILIDPDYTHDPEPNIKYILVSHAHMDHIARIADLPTGNVLASADVCEIAVKLGIDKDRVYPVVAGNKVDNIQILPGFSMVNDPVYSFFYMLFRRKLPEPGGTPLSFLVEDHGTTLLHIGDAHEVDLDLTPDILCLPWRTTPFGPNRYKNSLIKMIKQLSPKYILPIHYDLPGTEAAPSELTGRVDQEVLMEGKWHDFYQGRKIQ